MLLQYMNSILTYTCVNIYELSITTGPPRKEKFPTADVIIKAIDKQHNQTSTQSSTTSVDDKQ